MPQTKPIVSIENVVASATINQPVTNYTNISRSKIIISSKAVKNVIQKLKKGSIQIEMNL